MADFSVVGAGGFVLGGVSGVGLKNTHYVPSSGLFFGGTSPAEPTIVLTQEFTWNIGAVLELELTFRWDLGKQALHYYTVQGECQRPPTCETTGVNPNDNNCASGGARFTQTIAARSLADLCQKLKTLLLNYPVTWPISKILRHSRPVYINDVNFVADEDTRISKLADGTTITVITQPDQILVITRLPSGVTSSTTIPVRDGVVNDVLPDGTFVSTVLENGTVSSVTLTKPDGTVNVQHKNSILVVTTDSARDTTIASQITNQLGTLAESCNELEEQVYCQIPECLEFCVSEYHITTFSARSFFQNVFYNYEASGGFVLDGQVAPISPARIASGGFILGGSANITAGNITYPATGGLILSGTAPRSSNAWLYTASGGLVLSGEAPVVSPIQQFQASGGLILSGVATARLALAYRPNSGFVFGGTSATTRKYNFKTTGSGGLILGGTGAKSSNVYNFAASSGFIFSGEVLTKSPAWHYVPNGGFVFGGSSLVGLNYLSTGGVVLAGESTTRLALRYTPSSGFIFGGVGNVLSSPSWHVIGSGGFILGSSASSGFQNLGVYTTTFSGSSELLLMEAAFPSYDPEALTLEADTGTIISNCGCNPVPIKLKIKHNLNDTTVLKEFLFRNNLTLPATFNLVYSRYDDLWRSIFHFRGTGSDSTSAEERWTLVFEWTCSYPVLESDSKVWKFSVLISRLKLNTPTERYDTRILYSFKPEDICNDNEVKFAFVVDTRTGELVTPTEIIVPEAVLSDDIGLFDGKLWRKTNQLIINIAEAGLPTDTPTKDIYPIFPEQS